jgi:hypothetical protein
MGHTSRDGEWRPPRWVAPLFALAALVLVPWIVFLVRALPSAHVVAHWDIAWGGFDVALALVLLAVAIAAWRHSPWLEGAASAAATLLFVDAWFDVMSAATRAERAVAVAEALLVEVPLAFLCLLLARDTERRFLRPLLERVEATPRRDRNPGGVSPRTSGQLSPFGRTAVPKLARLVPIPLAALGVLAALVLAGRAPASTADAQTLHASVGPGFAISLRDDSGARVTHLDAGTYTIVVNDQSDEHNFHLTGPGVDKSTAVDSSGTETWTVTLQDGNYDFECDAHPTIMKGAFTVGAATPPTTTAPTTTTTPIATTPSPSAAAKLVATVGPGFTISLRTAAGAPVKRLRHGRYRIVVRDRAAVHNFHLVGPGVNRSTKVPFVGTSTWTLTLGRGTFAFRCDPHRAVLHGAFSVT